VWVCGGTWLGLEDEEVNQNLAWEGVGSEERRTGELWDEKRSPSRQVQHAAI